ncbi:MAG TPA: metallophosphoesterase family protein [Anaerolineae bacterium]
MRIALISDIHGNLVSLEAVLADIERERPDELICLGDVATLGPQPREVVARLRALDCPCITGNHETYLFNADLGRAYMDVAWFAQSIDWCRDQLTASDFEYLRTFKPLLKLTLDATTTLLCFHGSPESNTDNIFAVTPADELDRMLAGHTATMMIGGHTHVQMLRQYRGTLVVNVGSVGMPFEQMPFKDTPRVLPWAEYAIISYVRGVLSVEMRRVPVDMSAIKQSALNSTMPEADEWIRNWVTPG